ncbi:MAG: PAS domain S-box protein, partial [Pseudomonadota bacterium]
MKTSYTGSESETPTVALRRRAEAIDRGKAFRVQEDMESLSVEATRQVLHELRVHQIELEMQNEELHRIQVELEASRAQYFDLYDLAPVGYCTLSEDGLILEANLTAAALLGAARGALVRQQLPLFILPEDQDIYYRHRKLLFETGAPQICELRLVKKDTAPFWVRIDTIAVQDVDGASVCRATMIDITERKRAEEALQESEERFRSYLENAPDGIYMNNLEGTFLYGNRKCEEIIGYRREELIGKNLLELNILPEKSLNLAVKRLQANMEGRSTGPDEIELIGKEGRIIPVEINTSVVQRMGQRAVLSFARDITERKRAEEDFSLHVTRTQALLDLHIMANDSQKAIMDFVLEAAQNACRSQFSFIGLLDETESFMTIHAWSKDTMAQCSSLDKPIHFPISEAGVWGDCVRQRKPVTINEYEAPWPGRKGYPDGHVPIRRFLSVPISDGSKIVAVAAVANKKEPYIEDDVHALISIVNKMWEVLRRKRVEEELKRTLDSLRKAVGVTIQVMVSAVETRDPYTAGHQVRSANLARNIAAEMGLPQEKID